MTTTQETAFKHVFSNLSAEKLIEKALENKEGVLSANQAFVATTGNRTGRSPKDRFIVKDQTTANTVAWGVANQPFEADKFDALWSRALDYLADKEVFVSNLSVGADEAYALPVKLITDYAWHHLFAQNLFIRTQRDLNVAGWTLVNAAGFATNPKRDGGNSDATLVINITARKILLCGFRYAGEMKKAMFSVMNFLLPARDVLPMHCSANVGEEGDVALFFGLSGTGKTTLSADPQRYLIGDDEHGWSAEGVFNFEGGCYAKCIDLSQENEPSIWNAIRRGAIMENVILNSEGEPDYADTRLTQNTRVAYPLEHIVKRVEKNKAGHPKAVIFLTCDCYGLLPPVAKLNKEQAAYHFLSGYTALVGGTEVGMKGVTATFSTCFGEPFFARPPREYANLLMKRIEETGAQVYWVNTGWTGGAYGTGKRFSIPITRTIITAILNGDLNKIDTFTLPGFNIEVPKFIKDVDVDVLNPRNAWGDKLAYDQQLAELIARFNENFKRFDVPEAILKAGPQSE